MTYTQLVAIAIGCGVLTDLAVLRTRLVRTAAFWLAYAIMLTFQLILNGALTGLGVVSYDRHTILGLRIAFAPVEDLGFGFALILLSLSCWARLTRSAAASAGGGRR